MFFFIKKKTRQEFIIILNYQPAPFFFIKKKTRRGIKFYTYPNRKEAVLAYTKLLDIQFLIENVFDKYPLVTLNQRQRYNLLRTGILNKIKRFDNLEEYNKFKVENSVVTEYNIRNES